MGVLSKIESGESGLLQSAPDLQCISAQVLTWQMLGKSVMQLLILLATALLHHHSLIAGMSSSQKLKCYRISIQILLVELNDQQ